MPVTTIAGREVQVKDEGVLTVYDEWDEDLAKNLAAQIGIDLTDAHWKAILFLREDTVRPDESGPSVVNDDGKASAGLRAVNEDPP